MLCQMKKQVKLLSKGEPCKRFLPFLLGKEACRKLDKIILAVLTAVVTVCAEAAREKNKED